MVPLELQKPWTQTAGLPTAAPGPKVKRDSGFPLILRETNKMPG